MVKDVLLFVSEISWEEVGGGGVSKCIANMGRKAWEDEKKRGKKKQFLCARVQKTMTMMMSILDHS